MIQFSNSSRVIGVRDHFKNGASSKSQMSRVSFKLKQMFSNYSKVMAMITISTMCVAGVVNAQTKLQTIKPAENKLASTELPNHVLKGTTAPDFILPDLAGNMVSLSSMKGKYIVLVFWLTDRQDFM